MILHRINPRDVGNYEGVIGNAEFAAQRGTNSGIRPELIQVYSVWNDLRPAWPIAKFQVRLQPGGGIGRDQIGRA